MDSKHKTAEKTIEKPAEKVVADDADLDQPELAQPEPETKAKQAAAPTVELTSRAQDPEELIRPLKELIATLERRQKVTQEIGDFRSVLQNLVSGELISGEELERAKQVIQSLGKLVKATIDHQNALAAAEEVMPALDKILGLPKKAQ